MRLPIQPAFDFHTSDAMRSKPDKSFAAIHGSTAVPHVKFIKKRLAMLLVASGLAVCAANVTQAAVTVTAATGGTNISADKAQNATAPAFTTLGNIVILEGANGDFATGTGVTLILTAPSGWRFSHRRPDKRSRALDPQIEPLSPRPRTSEPWQYPAAPRRTWHTRAEPGSG